MGTDTSQQHDPIFRLLVLKGHLLGCVCHIPHPRGLSVVLLQDHRVLQQVWGSIPSPCSPFQAPSASQTPVFNFSASGAKSLMGWCQSIPLTTQLWSHTWILIRCLLSAKARGELCHYTYWSEGQVSSGVGCSPQLLGWDKQHRLPLHHTFLRLSTMEQERRDTAKETQTLVSAFATKEKEAPLCFWWQCVTTTALHTAPMRHKYTALLPRYMWNSLFLPAFYRCCRIHPSPPLFLFLWTEQSQYLHFALTGHVCSITNSCSFPPCPTFELFCCFWKLWAENWFMTPAETPPSWVALKDRYTLSLVNPSLPFHNCMSLVTHGQHGIHHQIQTLSTVLLGRLPLCIGAALYSHLSLQVCAHPFLDHLLLFPGDSANTLNPNPVFQKAQSSSHISIACKCN